MRLKKPFTKRFCKFLWPACVVGLVLGACLLGAAGAQGAEPAIRSATYLRAKYAALGPRLGNNPFNRPLVLDSAESANQLSGDIYALLDYPFETVNQSFNGATHWCDMLILHINTKYCRASPSGTDSMLAVNIGKKDFQELGQAYRVQFLFSVVTATPDYFDVSLYAPTGPLGTSDYRIGLEAVALPGGKTFLHLTYSYRYGFAGKLAMQTYLATLGSHKIGFTFTGAQGSAQAIYIGGVRGVVERNTMRYYLAIDAFLSAVNSTPSQQLEQRLQSWFSSTELYAAQLHEVDRDAYLDMKRREYARQLKSP